MPKGHRRLGDCGEWQWRFRLSGRHPTRRCSKGRLNGGMKRFFHPNGITSLFASVIHLAEDVRQRPSVPPRSTRHRRCDDRSIPA